MMKLCEVCDNEIPRGQMSYTNKKYQAKKYCGAICHHASMKKEFEYNCSDCKEKVIRTKEGITTNVFCDDTCKGRYRGKRNGEYKTSGIKYTVTCLNCNKQEVVISSRKNRKFCGQNCRAKYNAKIITEKQKNQVTVNCNHCEEEIVRKASSINDMNFCNYDCMHSHYSEESLFSGENSGTWNGGRLTYYGSNWLSQRRKVRKRDNYTCQKCGIDEKEYGQELSVHHITPFVMFDDYLEANKDDNLTSVCEPCHREIHSGDNHPSKFLKTFG